MGNSVLSLVLHGWYGGDEADESAAAEELKERGWGTWSCVVIRALIIPLIIIERLVAGFGGDIYDFGPPPAKDILFSIVFSVWTVTALPALLFLLPWLFGGVVSFSVILFIFTSVLLLLPVWRRA